MTTPTHQHTSGPWMAHYFPYGAGLCVVTNPPSTKDEQFKGQVIASKTTCPDWEANAKLIAASPDLLAALELVNAKLPAKHGTQWQECSLIITTDEYLTIRAAIAKATA